MNAKFHWHYISVWSIVSVAFMMVCQILVRNTEDRFLMTRLYWKLYFCRLVETKIATTQPKEPQTTGQEYPEKETPASKRGLKITPGARPKFPTMFGSKATRALIGKRTNKLLYENISNPGFALQTSRAF